MVLDATTWPLGRFIFLLLRIFTGMQVRVSPHQRGRLLNLVGAILIFFMVRLAFPLAFSPVRHALNTTVLLLPCNAACAEPLECPSCPPCGSTAAGHADSGSLSAKSMGLVPSHPAPVVPSKDEVMALFAGKPKCQQAVREGHAANKFNGQFSQDWFAFVNFWNTPYYGYTDTSRRANLAKGFYVDVGANHPFKHSNTWFLDECLGWKGICVEANPEMAELLRAQRSCEVVEACAHPSRKSVSFQTKAGKDSVYGQIVEDSDIYKKQQGRLGQGTVNIEVPCHPLHEILSQRGINHVDFMSLDIEGAELGALVSAHLDKVQIDTITMENNFDIMEQRWFPLRK
eukprot:gene4382-796_t